MIAPKGNSYQPTTGMGDEEPAERFLDRIRTRNIIAAEELKIKKR